MGSFKMPNVKLTYFNLRARGEPCRLLLAYGGIKYEDERIPPPWDPTSTWSTLKPTTPFGQLPILNWDGVEICQSMASARFIAREGGPATPAWSRARSMRLLTSSRTSSTPGSNSTLPRTRLVSRTLLMSLFKLLRVNWRRSLRVEEDNTLLATT